VRKILEKWQVNAIMPFAAESGRTSNDYGIGDGSPYRFLRKGARQPLQAALENEVAEYL
jgi:hypothetical protein